jgi:hypothetical protein
MQAEPDVAEPRPQLLARGMKRLVKRPACRAGPFGENVDRHVVERDRDQHGALM